ncbi:MAG: hypothetical protein ACREM2_11425, partial [Vulcanimicrobiaceae bacterium]
AWSMSLGAQVILPAGAQLVPATLDARLSSQEAHAGERFFFHTTAARTLGGLAIPSGTAGYGLVVAAQSARGAAPGSLALRAVALTLSDGKSLRCRLAPGSLSVRLNPNPPALAPPEQGPALVFGAHLHDTNVVYERGTAFALVVGGSGESPPDARRSERNGS